MPLSMQNKKVTNEDLLYFLAFILALGVRLLNLGALPLTDFEAGWAIQAFDLSRGSLEISGPHPGFINLTGLLFSVFGSSDAMARLLPALVGSLMVLAPLAFRKKLSRRGALILAYALALDPGLVVLSRQAGGPMMAIGFLVLALSLAYARKPAWSGICLGLALLSGPSIWIGLLGLGIALAVSRLLGISLEADSASISESTATPASPLQTEIIFTVGTILLVGSLFSTYPAGLGAWANSLTAFFSGWAQPSNVPVLRLLLALLVYAPMAVIFALVAIVQEWQRERAFVFLTGVWTLAALGVVLVYPGRQVGDIAWVIIPLWALAARAISMNIGAEVKESVALGQGAATIFLLALAWLTLAGLRFTIDETQRLHWLLILGIILLGGLSSVFVGLGWSWNVARAGSVLGVVVALGFYSISTMIGASQWRATSPLELWTPLPGSSSNRLFADTLRDLSLTSAGEENSLEIVSLLDTPSLRWNLRNFSRTSFVESLAEISLPPVVITNSDGEFLPWVAAYRGQDFAWEYSPGWWGPLPADWMEWLVSRQAPLQSNEILLWARSDLFPDQPQTQAEGIELPLEEAEGGE